MEHTLDATNQSLGRLATQVATLLRGKHLPTWTPHIMPDTKVVVTNLDKIEFKGSRMDTKKYHHFSGYHGGITTRTLREAWARNPQEVFRQSVLHMLPENRLRRDIIKNLSFK